MAPAKAARNGHDDAKSETPNSKEKNGAGVHQSNGKLRRVASSTGTNLREMANAGAAAAASALMASAAGSGAAVVQEASNPGLQWPAFDREVLHAYRRSYGLNTPTAFTKDHHKWILTQPGSVGLYSPTIARSSEFRRQTKDQLTSTVRKHFNGLGVQENDIIVDFLHKVRSQGVLKRPKSRTRRAGNVLPEEQ
ncbi:hypothetical protein B0H63DRAFT_465899 [Podospora didyma]|uniref:Histone deacetylase complex subunit SAP30 Sin3 binding domain-containing protein n=1 Tax=Podospora didyma TaxID=330526 RepID=A0AAE0P000_9PEZI|nr:hypothetical protein B0H63DRAFT_465899 [Podospora didyma]